MNDIDSSLRGFRSHLDEAHPGALARARARALRHPVDEAPGRGRMRWIALPAAAATVAATAVAASLMLNHTPAARQLPPAASPDPPTTAELVEAWAQDIAAGPDAPPAAVGQTIAITFDQVLDGNPRSVLVTVQRDGLITTDNSEYGSMASFQQAVANHRAAYAATGPTWRMPSPAWLDALDPSPANIMSVVEASLGCPCSAETIWGEIANRIASADIVLPPALRAGLLRTLATLPGVSAYESTVDGTAYRVLALQTDGARRELYIDPASGLFAGEATESVPGALPQASVVCVSTSAQCPPTGDSAELPARSTISWWEQTLVTP